MVSLVSLLLLSSSGVPRAGLGEVRHHDPGMHISIYIYTHTSTHTYAYVY